MGMVLFYYVVFLFSSFAVMYFAFFPQAKNFEKSGNFTFFMQPILYIFMLYALGSIGAYYLIDKSDFIAQPVLWRILLPLFCACLIYAADLIFGEKTKSAVLLLSIAACIYFQPLEAKFVPFGLNEYVFKSLIVIFFFVFCLYYKILNILPHTIVIASITMLMGVSIISFIGAAPLYLALVCSFLIGGLCGYLGVNLHRVKIDFDNISCTVLAFLLCNIFMLDISELSFSSCVVFTMVFWAELALTLYNKLFINQSAGLIENSPLFVAAQNLTLNSLMSNIFKLGLICMFFGWFQLFSVNQYSLPIITFCVILWLNTSMGTNLLQTPKSLKQINSEFVSEIKQNLKETFSQIKNKKD